MRSCSFIWFSRRKTPKFSCIVFASSSRICHGRSPSRRSSSVFSSRSASASADGGTATVVCVSAQSAAGGSGAPAVGDRLHERVPAEPVRAVHRDARALAGRVQAFELGDAQLVVGVDAAHVVVGARPDRDRLVDRVDAGEGHRQLARPVQALEDLLRAQVPQVEQDVPVDAAALVDLDLLGPRDDVAAGELHRVRRVVLEEAVALRVQEVRALAAAALGDQDARSARASSGETASSPCP